MPPVDPDAKIPCPTPQHLQAELDALSTALSLEEKEDTWEKMEKALIRFAGVTRGGGYKHLTQYVEGVGRKGVGLQVAACMLSDRGRLSGVAIELLQTLAPRLANHFLPLISVYLDPLVKLLGRPNKVFLKRAEKCLATIISHCHLAAILPGLRQGLFDEAATCRRGSAAGMERAMREWEKEVFGEKGVGVVEEGLRKMATDKDPEVRGTGKRVWATFCEVWPERVEDFSAPLTPTIRRYLDISSNGGPIKPKPASRPIPPPLRPVAAALSASASSAAASSSTAVANPPPPQHHRANALGGKAFRPPLAIQPLPASAVSTVVTIDQEDAADAFAAQRRQVSPRKAIEPLHVRPMPQDLAFPDSAPLRSLARSTTGQADLEPPILFKHTRSVSHAVLPSGLPSSTANHVDMASYPLSKPSRPVLPPSFSTVSLPADPLDIAARRLPPPARPAPTPVLRGEDESEANQGFFTPGGPLRGAVRPPPNPLGAKRPLGQAQRRVVTAPSQSMPDVTAGLGLGMPTPAARPARSVREKVLELERNSPTRVDLGAKTSSPPRSPMATTSASEHAAEDPNRPYRSRDAVVLAVNSPLMPVLTRSTATANARQYAADQSSEDLLRMMEGPRANFWNPSAPPPACHAVSESKVSGEETVLAAADTQIEDKEPTKTMNNETVEADLCEQHHSVDVRSDATADPTDVQGCVKTATGSSFPDTSEESAQTLVRVADLAESVSAINPEVLSPVEQRPLIPAASTAGEARTVQTRISACVVSDPDAIQAHVPAVAATGSAKTAGQARTTASAVAKASKPAADVKLPPVAGSRMAHRVVSAPERRPFKPTSQAAKPSTATAPTASTAARAAAAAKVVPKSTTEALNKSTSTAPKLEKASLTSAVPIVSEIIPKPAASATTKPTTSNFAAPTKASASRGGPTSQSGYSSHPKPGPAITAHVTLPPIKKEKVRLKAPTPSFVPTRTNAGRSVSDRLATSTSTSMSSSQSASDALRRKGVGVVAKVRVKPESIPLPMSPEEKARLPPAAIPLPPSPTPAGLRSWTSSPTSSVGVKRDLVGVVAKVRSMPQALGGSPGRELPQASSANSRAEVGKVEMPMPRSPLAQSSFTTEVEEVVDPERGVRESPKSSHSLVSLGTPSRAVRRPASDSSTAQADTHEQQVEPLSSLPVIELDEKSEEGIEPTAGLNGLGLPLAPADPQHSSILAMTPLSKASTVPASPDTESEMDDEDDTAGITSKGSSGGEVTRAGGDAVRSRSGTVSGDLMEFSAPLRRADAEYDGDENRFVETEKAEEIRADNGAKLAGARLGSKTPPGSPRVILSVKDANTPRRGEVVV